MLMSEEATRSLSVWKNSIFPIVVLSQVVFFGAAWLGARVLPLTPAAGDTGSTLLNALAPIYYRWDARHYVDIALSGYGGLAGAVPDRRAAFFPVFPLLIRAAMLPFGRPSLVTAVLASIVVVEAAAFLAFRALFALVLEETGDARAARRSVLYTAVFPLAMFYFIPYTESIFLLASLGAFLAMRRHQWVRAGVWAGVASGTRLAGILLLPVLLLEIWLAWRRGLPRRAELWRGAAGLLLAPLGLLLFMLYLWLAKGDPLGFLHAQAQWKREMLFPVATLWRGIGYALHPAWSAHAEMYMHGVVQTSIVLLFLAVFVFSVRRWRPSYALYGLLTFAVALASPLAGEQTMQSTGRYVMVFFPVMLSLAIWGRRAAVHLVITTVWLALFLLLAALYSAGYFVG